MRRAKLLSPFIIAGFLLCLTLASSWYGALLYVHTYPMIIEYVTPLTWQDADGHEVTSVRGGRGLVLTGEVRRQPFSCWGSYTYGIRSESVSYQFPTVRSQELQDRIHDYRLKHFFVIPEGMPKGRYRLFVTIYPTCDGVDMRPSTLNFDTFLDINS
jgi:hypothetical protein